MKVIFPVAGLGTRFLPATKAVPKEMLPVVDRPLIQYAVDEAVEAGARSMIFISNDSKSSIVAHFDRSQALEARLSAEGKHDLVQRIRGTLPAGISRTYVPQPEALGLGHAVLCGRACVGDEAFGVILPDDLIYNQGEGCLAQMTRIHRETGHSVIAVEEVPPDQTLRYGIVSTEPFGDRTERLLAIVEKPDPVDAPSNLAVVGRYILAPTVMDLLQDTEAGAGGEIQLTDAIARLIESETVLCYRFRGQRYDCGSKLGFIQATVEYGLRDPELSDTLPEALQKSLDRLR